AGLESMSPSQRAQAAKPQAIDDGREVIFFGKPRFQPISYFPDLSHTYQQLADMYRRLGRPDDVAKMLTRLRAIANDRDPSLAMFFDRQGLPEEAAATYQRQVERAANPEQQAAALQSLANFYSSHQQYDEAVASL